MNKETTLGQSVEIWSATNALRILRLHEYKVHKLLNGIEHKEYAPYVTEKLQQGWVSSEGKMKWLDVEIVDETAST